jgi:hypothetical protein
MDKHASYMPYYIIDLIIDKTQIYFVIEAVLPLYIFRKAKVETPKKAKIAKVPKGLKTSKFPRILHFLPNFTLFTKFYTFSSNIDNLSVQKCLTTLVLNQFLSENTFFGKISSQI